MKPKPTRWTNTALAVLRRLLDLIAQNYGHARNASGDRP